ncbi:response regulator, partial [Corynebacterium propinquum]
MVQLTGGIAHDFNNFLTVIMGSLDALQDALPPGSGEHQLAGSALLGAERAASLTNQLLAYAKRQTLQTRPLQLAAFLQEIRGLLASTLGETSRLTLDAAPELPACELDPAQLTSALLNLVANARDAMPAGGEVVVSARHVSVVADERAPDGHLLPAGAYLVLAVQDSGSGVAAEHQARIFEPFFSTKGTEGGSGLGLPMVQGFARQSGGEVRLASAAGQGSRFELFFPASQQRARSAPAALSVSGRGEIVLVVEDNEAVRRQTLDMLRGAGFRVLEAVDGASAMGQLDRSPQVDLLLANLHLPNGMSGLDLAQHVRTLRPQLPVVLTTGGAAGPVAQRLRES